jgi:hypothetical protein
MAFIRDLNESKEALTVAQDGVSSCMMLLRNSSRQSRSVDVEIGVFSPTASTPWLFPQPGLDGQVFRERFELFLSARILI